MGPVTAPPSRARRVGRFLLELVSFGSARAHVINFAGILLILAAWPTNQLHYVPVRSVWENVFGFKPYSSGMMRALSRLLHGDVDGAWAFNPLAFIVLPLIVGLLALNAYRWQRQVRATHPADLPSP